MIKSFAEIITGIEKKRIDNLIEKFQTAGDKDTIVINLAKVDQNEFALEESPAIFPVLEWQSMLLKALERGDDINEALIMQAYSLADFFKLSVGGMRRAIAAIAAGDMTNEIIGRMDEITLTRLRAAVLFARFLWFVKEKETIAANWKGTCNQHAG